MFLILKMLMAAALAALAAVSYLGLAIESIGTALSHVTAGIFATILTVFIHSLFLFYLNGCARAMKEAAEDHPDLIDEYVIFTRKLRSRAYPCATVAILLILLGAFAGAHAHSELLGVHRSRVEAAASFLVRHDGEQLPALLADLSELQVDRLRALPVDGYATRPALVRAVEDVITFPVRGFPLWWLHLAILGAAIPVNLGVFLRELVLVAENVAGVHRLNGILAARAVATGG